MLKKFGERRADPCLPLLALNGYVKEEQVHKISSEKQMITSINHMNRQDIVRVWPLELDCRGSNSGCHFLSVGP